MAGDLVPCLERPERWNLPITQAFFCNRAARMKGATVRRIERARHVALQQQPPFPGGWVGLGSGAEKRFRLGMTGIAVDLLRGREFHHAPEVHDRDSPADVLHDVQVVSNE